MSLLKKLDEMEHLAAALATVHTVKPMGYTWADRRRADSLNALARAEALWNIGRTTDAERECMNIPPAERSRLLRDMEGTFAAAMRQKFRENDQHTGLEDAIKMIASLASDIAELKKQLSEKEEVKEET